MSTFLHVLLWLILAAVALWAFIFGGIGAAIARVRSRTLWSGFGWGFCLGPIGWLVLLFAPRRRQLTTFRSNDPEPPWSRSEADGSGRSAHSLDEEPSGPPDVL